MASPSSPFAFRNIQLFIAFRILFNCRFYYPVFTILFLDYGLTIEQFALLNTVWAITIVCAEVPSGALADVLGRKRLLMMTSFLMVLELGVIAFVPLANISLVFWAFLINRVISGLAEAMASGADEAIAYDTLAENNLAHCWPRVLSLQMRLKSVGSILTAASGALIYDPEMVNRLLSWMGSTILVHQQQSMRYPVFLTLVLALFASLASMLFEERENVSIRSDSASFFTHILQAMGMTWKAGQWILRSPFALAVIIVGMFYDHVLRLLITLTSQYYRLIQIPEASFGIIASAMSLLGLYMPKVCEKMVEKYSPQTNLLVLFAISFVAILIMRGFYPYVGVVAICFIYIGLTMVSFFSSHYLNAITESSQRATVLSFKGMAYNLGYGLIGVFFALLMRQMQTKSAQLFPEMGTQQLEDQSFIFSIEWFPLYLVGLFMILVFWLYRIKPHNQFQQSTTEK